MTDSQASMIGILLLCLVVNTTIIHIALWAMRHKMKEIAHHLETIAKILRPRIKP